MIIFYELVSLVHLPNIYFFNKDLVIGLNNKFKKEYSKESITSLITL